MQRAKIINSVVALPKVTLLDTCNFLSESNHSWATKYTLFIAVKDEHSARKTFHLLSRTTLKYVKSSSSLLNTDKRSVLQTV